MSFKGWVSFGDVDDWGEVNGISSTEDVRSNDKGTGPTLVPQRTSLCRGVPLKEGELRHSLSQDEK